MSEEEENDIISADIHMHQVLLDLAPLLSNNQFESVFIHR